LGDGQSTLPFSEACPADLRFSPTLVVNIWDVTDKSIDRFSQSVIEKIHLNKATLQNWSYDDLKKKGQCSVVAAVASSRDECKLKYLTGAAPVVYGIPFYL
jgi:separase